MKLKYFTIIITACLSIMALVSCESHEQKADEAFESFKEEKMNSKDSIIIYKDTASKKSENTDEWSKFKIETEKKIASNEKMIRDIRNIQNASASLLKKIAGIEKENNDFKRQMDEYKEDIKVKWENFKGTMNHDVDKIGIELKDITIKNKK